jgi:hypothetical protein
MGYRQKVFMVMVMVMMMVMMIRNSSIRNSCHLRMQLQLRL